MMLWCRYCKQQVGPAGQCGCYWADERRWGFDKFLTEKPR